MPTAQYQKTTHHSSQLLQSIVLDFENYTNIFSGIESAVVIKPGPPIWEVSFRLYMIRRLAYTLSLEAHENNGVFELRWSLIDGFFHSNSGYWRFESAGNDIEGDTEVSYFVNVLTDTVLPSSMIQTLTTRRLPSVVNQLIEEADRRSGGAPE